MLTVMQLKEQLGCSYNTAKDMIKAVANTGSTCVFCFNNKAGVFDFEEFIKTLNKINGDKIKCEKKSTKEENSITLTQQLMVEEYENQLEKIL